MEEKKDNTPEKEEAKASSSFAKGYKEGAVVGGIVGILIAVALKKNIMVGGVVGLIGGGYIGYKINNTENEQHKKLVKPKTN